MKIHTKFKVPEYFKNIGNPSDEEFVIGESCEELRKYPWARKILVLNGRGFLEAGKCTADFYARNLLEAYLWIRLQLS